MVARGVPDTVDEVVRAEGSRALTKAVRGQLCDEEPLPAVLLVGLDSDPQSGRVVLDVDDLLCILT